MNFKNTLIMLSVLTPATLGSSQIATAKETIRFNLGCSTGACLVPPWEGPAQVPEFKHNGMTLEHPRQTLSFFDRWRYYRLLKRFPDAASCLPLNVSDENGFDLLRFDWSEQKSIAQLDVCLSRIHSAIANPVVSAQWFEAFGFRAFLITEPEDSVFAGQSTMHVDWLSDAEFPAKYVEPWLTRQLWGPGFSMGLSLDKDNIVQDVSIIFNWM